MTKKAKLLFEGSEWSFATLERAMILLDQLSKELRLNTYPNQIEIIGSEQMLDAYASTGLPVMYNHWSFGKAFSREQTLYQQGKRGLAYEIVINSNPSISYLMEENSACTNIVVLAHAAYGHNHFFKNNYLFKEWTDASSILDYLGFAKNYITQCEEKYGLREVEAILDSAHSLRSQSIDHGKRPAKLSLVDEKLRQEERENYLQTQVNDLWDKTITKGKKRDDEKPFPEFPEENILYFLEKHSPILEGWQREVLRIVRKINQYFYPQAQTKIMNEGWACFTHYYLTHRLWENGYISDGGMIEFYSLHTNVLVQPPFDSKYFSGINPYYLGFEMFRDIQRMCEHPDDEDKEMFPDLVNRPWLDAVLRAVEDFRDESFIRQFLGPKVIRKMRLFNLYNDTTEEHFMVNDIHDAAGFNVIKSTLANSVDMGEHVPRIEVVNANIKTDRKLTLRYHPKQQRELHSSVSEVLTHVYHLWGHPVELVAANTGNVIGTVSA